MISFSKKIIVVGVSTGGTDALRTFLEAMPPDAPGICIVQHLPEKVTAVFTRYLNSICRISVREAEQNDTVLSGQAPTVICY